MKTRVWLKFFNKPCLEKPLAIVGSPGLRSVGKLALKYLVKEVKAKRFAELYSSSFPILYDTKPSYATMPRFPGIAGVKVKNGGAFIPRVRFYFSASPELIMVRGYHANFEGQYEVAEKVVEVLEEFKVKRMFVLAGYGWDGPQVCCAASNHQLIEEMKKFGLTTGYVGPFMGFSGLVFGLGVLKNIEGICLFGKTQPHPEKPEFPDPEAGKNVFRKLREILSLNNGNRFS